MPAMRSRSALAVPVLLVALAASGCSFSASAGTTSVSTGDLEAQLTEQLTELAGQAPDDVDCPDPLPAEVGAEVRCTLTAGDGRIGVTATTTSVEDERVLFDIEVDEEPLAEGEEA